MHLFRSDAFPLPLPAGHRFPTGKYRMLLERLRASKAIHPTEFHVAEAATDAQLQLCHAPEYVARVQAGELTQAELRAIGFPWSPGMVERSRRSTGATVAACRSALIHGVAANMAGGTHHAHAQQGAGFCVFNDAAVAARVLQADGLIHTALVVDCDVHQGDGTARILADDPTVFTFSIHGERNYPTRKATSDLDVGLPDRAGDAVYLGALQDALERIRDHFTPDLVVYLAGADPYLDDRYGRLALTKAGLLARDRLVLTHYRSAGIPVALAMAGGYARNIEDSVEIHANTLLLAAEYWHRG